MVFNAVFTAGEARLVTTSVMAACISGAVASIR
jgi:hypothetical protein